ncbi:hypothetical protein OROGR_015042 [Orobanche gracilis]
MGLLRVIIDNSLHPKTALMSMPLRLPLLAIFIRLTQESIMAEGGFIQQHVQSSPANRGYTNPDELQPSEGTKYNQRLSELQTYFQEELGPEYDFELFRKTYASFDECILRQPENNIPN